MLKDAKDLRLELRFTFQQGEDKSLIRILFRCHTHHFYVGVLHKSKQNTLKQVFVTLKKWGGKMSKATDAFVVVSHLIPLNSKAASFKRHFHFFSAGSSFSSRSTWNSLLSETQTSLLLAMTGHKQDTCVRWRGVCACVRVCILAVAHVDVSVATLHLGLPWPQNINHLEPSDSPHSHTRFRLHERSQTHTHTPHR